VAFRPGAFSVLWIGERQRVSLVKRRDKMASVTWNNGAPLAEYGLQCLVCRGWAWLENTVRVVAQRQRPSSIQRDGVFREAYMIDAGRIFVA
jgi:hypothetical protein